MKKILQPFAYVSKQTLAVLIIVQTVMVLAWWHFSANGLMPVPGKIAAALAELSVSSQLWDNILISLLLTLKAMLYAIIITMLISWLSVIPFFKSLAQVMVKCRYLTLAGLIFVFTLLTQNGAALKLWLLIAGIVPFFVTSFLSVIVNIHQQEYDLCKTLGYNNWRTLYEVIIVGKADKVLEIIQQNFAIAWLMITMVEGVSMSEGGIGTLLIKYNKYNDLTKVLALQIVIFLLGLLFDYLLYVMRLWLFPYIRKTK